MSDEAGRHIGSGLAWLGFWLMIGFANFGERPISDTYNYYLEAVEQKVKDLKDETH